MPEHNFFNFIMEPTCFKSVSNPSCIDLILTNQKFSFKNTSILEISKSDFHRMALAVTTSTFEKIKPTSYSIHHKYMNCLPN